MVVEVPRRWRWIIGVLAALALVELLMLWRVDPPGDEEPPSAAVSSPPEASAAMADDTARATDAPGSTPASSRRAEEIEVCGVGWMRAVDDVVDPRAWMRQRDVLRARDSTLERLRAGSEFDRVVAQWLALRGVDGPPAGDPASDAARDAVARAATTTSDPRVYALAFNLCQLRDHQSTGGACQLIDARQWARLDPDNANPWLHVLTDASQRKDRAMQDEALYRIAASRRSTTYFMALPGAIAGIDTPDAPSTAAVMALAVDTLGTTAAFAFPGYATMLGTCRGDELKDANRRQNCEAIAALMTDRSDSLLERGIGARMSVNLGAPESRADEIRGEINGYANSVQLAAFVPDNAALDCRAMHRDLQRLTQWAAVGEVQSAHDWARQSGKTPAVLGEEYRAMRERTRIAAERDAAASAAASRPP